MLRLLNLHKALAENKELVLSAKEKAQMLIITTVHERQHDKVYGDIEQIKDRIVSLTMRAVLDKEKGIKLASSFGNEKNHYLLQKINAKNVVTEKC